MTCALVADWKSRGPKREGREIHAGGSGFSVLIEDRKIIGAAGLVSMLMLATMWHVQNVQLAKRQLAAIDPSFVRIVATEDFSADCGRFVSETNGGQFPRGERFYRRGGEIRVQRQGPDAYGPFTGACYLPRRGGLYAALIDPVVLPLFGRKS